MLWQRVAWRLLARQRVGRAKVFRGWPGLLVEGAAGRLAHPRAPVRQASKALAGRLAPPREPMLVAGRGMVPGAAAAGRLAPHRAPALQAGGGTVQAGRRFEVLRRILQEPRLPRLRPRLRSS